MIEEIAAGLFRIEVPLPRNPLRSINAYLLRGEDRALLIDTGLNREECLAEMLADLAKLAVDRTRTDFFVTHFHVDHLGLLAKLAAPASKVYFNKPEADIVNFLAVRENRLGFWEATNRTYLAHGFPGDVLRAALEVHPGRRPGLRRMDFTLLSEGDTIAIGDYVLRVIETPGHSPGHLCLYEAGKKLLFSGDHILFDITPNITYWSDTEKALKSYLASLEKVYHLDVDLALPGHRNGQRNHRARIRGLQAHHQARAGEILDYLEDGPRNVFEITPHVTWDVPARSWGDFPPAQKWFAFGETLAHLQYLADEGLVTPETRDDKVVFSRTR
ncbi:MAG: MBL fold metallo-hydrolase [Chloroflexi bacterium]|nr:MBL fold metallo-hydrolase [Chloroflexota bacterium]